MQTNDAPVGAVTSSAEDGGAEPHEMVDPGQIEPGRSRRRRPRSGKTDRVSPRFTPADRGEVDAAAASVGMSLSRFCAEAALAAARGAPMPLLVAQDREVLVRLQRQLFDARTAVARFGVNVNQAVAVLHATGEVPVWLERAVERVAGCVGRLDVVVAEVDRRLR